MARLIIKSGEKLLSEVNVTKTIAIGREAGDILIKNPAVSARHCQVEKIGLRYVLSDFGSTNGTYIGDERITSKDLRHGDIFTIGKFIFEFDNPEDDYTPVTPFEDESDLSGKTMVMSADAFKDVMAGSATAARVDPEPSEEPAKLFVSQGSETPKLVTLDKDVLLLGSGSSCDVILKGFTIGKVCAIIRKNNDRYQIVYQGGMAKLKFDGKAKPEKILEDGDRFAIGSYRFEFRNHL